MERNIKVEKNHASNTTKVSVFDFLFLKTSVLLHRIILKGTNVASVS